MEYIIILGICFLAILIIKIALDVKIKDIKRIKEIGYDKNLNEITNQLPDNKKVCEEILKHLGNNTVTIQTSEGKQNSTTLSYYSVISNNIIIADIKDTFTRIQTIAHECVHSIQNRKTLLVNFIFSNIYLIYFFIICILTVIKGIKQPLVWLVILIIMGFIYYMARSYLETDAMKRAPYVAKEYMEKSGKISKEQLDTVMKNYKELNSFGIPITNFSLMLSVLSKVIIYLSIIILVK